MMVKFIPFEVTRKKLIAKGYLESSPPHALTEAGHEWTRALIKRAYAHDAENSYLKG